MDKETMIVMLNGDLENERAHMMFYLRAASNIAGLHRQEFQEFFQDQAKEEMGHVLQFQEIIIGMGGVLSTGIAPYYDGDYSCPSFLLQKALEMEEAVVKNYVQRIKAAESLAGVDGKFLEIFLEEQIMHSRTDVDHLRQLLKRID